MNLFRVRGIQLAVHPTFFLFLAYAGYEGWQAEGWIGAAWMAGTLLTCFTCVILHEFGHSFTARAFGIGVPRILLTPIGGIAEFDNIPREPGKELLITLAGPAVNFVIAGGLWLAVGVPYGWPRRLEIYSDDALGFARLLLTWNIAMGLFNLIPAFPMDGGRILRALLAIRLPYLRATWWAATMGKIIALACIAAALAAPELGFSDQRYWMLAILFSFIFIAGEREYRGARQREELEAHWREVYARRYGTLPMPPASEPPVLSR